MLRRTHSIGRRVVLIATTLAGLLLAGCSQSVGGPPSDGAGGDGRRGDSGVVMFDVPGDALRDVTLRDIPNPTDSSFVEPMCPDGSTSVVRMFDCDPVRGTGCGPMEGCYLQIEYPMGRCEREIYRANCRPAGTVRPGEACTGGDDCTPGSVCFVTGAGTRCLRLCSLDGSGPECQRGYICDPTDTPGVGACQ